MYEDIIASLESSSIVEKAGYSYFVHPLTNGVPSTDPAMINEIADWMTEAGDLNCDVILTPESMGIPYAVALSLKTGIPYSVVRRMSVGFDNEIEITQRTGYSKSSMYINGISEGTRVVIVDDVVSTGGTLNSIVSAIRMAKGVIVDILVPINKDGGAGKLLGMGVNVKTLFDLSVDKGKVHAVLTAEKADEESES